MSKPRDIYGRRPISQSRGRTHERILAMTHDPDVLPGAEHITRGRPDGSIADGVMQFNAAHVASLKVTARRAYERNLVLLLRDLEQRGPEPHSALDLLDESRLRGHLDWRLSMGLDDPTELTRCAVQLGHLAEWLANRPDSPSIEPGVRERLRARAHELAPENR